MSDRDCSQGENSFIFDLSEYKQIEQSEPRWHSVPFSLLMVAGLSSQHPHFIHPVLVGL